MYCNEETAKALSVLNSFSKLSNEEKVTKKFINGLDNAKKDMRDLIDKLNIDKTDIDNQINYAQGIINGIEYIQNYILGEI